MSQSVLFYLIYPAIVAVISAFGSFYGSYSLQKRAKADEEKNLRRDFVEKMLMALTRLNALLEKLSDEPTKHGFFALKTLDAITPLLQRVQLLVEDKLALFKDEAFRGEILSVLEQVTAVVDETVSEERNPVDKYNEYRETVRETLAEYNDFKIKLLEMGFYLDDDNNPKNIDSTISGLSNEEKLRQIANTVKVFISKINDSQKQLDESNKQVKEHRAFLAVKLLTANSKIKDLISKLERPNF